MKLLRLLFQIIKFRAYRDKKRNKLLFFLLAVLATLSLAFVVLVFSKDFSSGKEIFWGVTFSKKYAEELGLNWRKTYLDILYDLKADRVRIPVYWDEVEKTEGVYDFEDYNWMVEAAKLAGAKVVLVLGRRQPRWPECFSPGWTRNLTDKAVNEKIIDLVKAEVYNFRYYENIYGWQIENEPLLSAFGECPPPDINLVKKEVELVKSLDPRFLIVTDSGELSSWFRISQVADILGTTMYRVVWNRHLGYLFYPLPPAYYRYKADVVSKLNNNLKKIIISELQVEPWGEGRPIREIPLERQFKSMSFDRMKMNLYFARATGMTEAYLWGVEWWYWLKTRQNHPEFWDLGKTLWQN
ncbi:hypothetical protein C4569_01900 [Candidatus Parcubacteria bacterium]|nr:MAG: hypothetical protein C4569_01900 [Candidatus Parcubacteria bacterium]